MTGLLDLRALLLLVGASALFTALAPAIYRRDPARRRLFLAVLAVALLVAPWWTAAGLWTWPLGLTASSLDLLEQPVPWLALAAWWGVGTLLVGRTLLRVCRGRSELRALPHFEEAAADAECHRLARRLGLTRGVSLREGPAPCASSLGEPILVLPPVARVWPAATRASVLAHELAHLKRLDDRLMLMIRLLTDWYWWMPWLRSVHRRYVEAMEEACDDLAAGVLAKREHYVDGLVDAARSVTGATPAADRWPAWVALLGHSHLAARVQRLLAVPRPTLHQADGRWALLWASLVFVVVLTARPAAVPDLLPASAELLPLTPVPRATADADRDDGHRGPRIEVTSFVRRTPDGRWRAVPDSARVPVPVYPAAALERGLEGRVTVELELVPSGSGLVRPQPPTITSSDPTGVLAAAVERTLGRGRGYRFGAGVRTVSIHNNDLFSPPPGTSLRLKTTYAFVLGSAQHSHLLEVEP